VLALALAGEVTRAEKSATELDKRFPLNTEVQRYWLPTIRAAIALEHKNPDKAVELLRAIRPYELGALWLIQSSSAGGLHDAARWKRCSRGVQK